LRARDQLNEITEKDLRFKLDEIKAFYRDVVSLRLTPDQNAEPEA
jgi:ATP/maltotriose-dependent transcriptional regulator MalT